MDGFDDLLNNSQSIPALDNPFEDLFARPRSPDPWDVFSQDTPHEQPPTTEPHHDIASPVTSTAETPQQSSDVADPLDAKAANEEDEQEFPSPTRLTSDAASSSHPSPTTSPITGTPAATTRKLASISEPEPEPSPPLVPPALDSQQETRHEKKSTPPIASSDPSTPNVPRTSAPEAEQPSTPPPGNKSTSPPQKRSTPRVPAVSPLESGTTDVQSSFAGLALGGEMPGWHGSASQSTFVNQEAAARLEESSGADAWNEHTNGENFVNGAPEPEDSDDDVPIAKVHPSTLSPSIEPPQRPEIQPMFVITVGDPQKVGDPVRPYITYTVYTRTTSPLYRGSSFSVLRRYSDFLWLYETLSINNPGVIVPPVPEKQQYGRFQDTFVENRRAALNKCIQKIANHPALRDDPDLKLFLESDSFVLDIKHRKAEIAHERGGLMASIGNTLVGPRFYETDEWFDNKKAYLDSLESQLRGLVKAIDMVSKQRSEVALAMADFAENVALLSSCDINRQLSHTLSVLAEVQRKAKELQDIQAREDVSSIMSTIDEYARLVNSVRLAFSSRVRLYGTWQNADSDLKKTQQAHEKARRQGRYPDRLSNSLSEIAEAERRVMEAKQEFDNASKLIKSELARFEQERVEDFKNALVVFLEGMISRQKEIIEAWESYQEMLLKRLGSNTNPAQAPNSVG